MHAEICLFLSCHAHVNYFNTSIGTRETIIMLRRQERFSVMLIRFE